MQTTINFTRRAGQTVRSLSPKVVGWHLAVWGAGLIWLNWPSLQLTVGYFNGGSGTLLLPSLYGTAINALLFYGTLALVRQESPTNSRTFWQVLLTAFIVLSVVEVVLDNSYAWIRYGPLSSWDVLDLGVGTVLLNGIFFLLPGLLYGILGQWHQLRQAPVSPPQWEGRITIQDGNKSVYLATNDLFYVESDRNYVVYHTRTRRIVVRKSLKQVAAELPAFFIRCHRSFIVNGQLIDRRTYNQLEIGEYKLPIGRKYAARLGER
ncbi:MAG: LytTR family DNA-binding domain-containing protein [Bacteroidota bacterium]